MRQSLLDKLNVCLDGPSSNVATLSQTQVDALKNLYEAAVEFDAWATRHNYPRGKLKAALDAVEIA